MDFLAAAALLMLLQSREIDGGFIITLEEPNGTLADNVLVQVSDSATNQSRRINLVPGRTFHLHCQADNVESNRGSSLDAIWYSGDDEVAVSNASDPNRPMIYNYLERNLNRRTLVLTNFTVGNVGVYRCRERGTSNMAGAAVVIGTRNPTVIAASETVVLRNGYQGNSRPVLMAFVSGTPYPSVSNIGWQFNNSQNLPSGVIENGHELLLPGNIRSEIAGVYMCHVTTSAGSDSANISVSLISQPSVSLSPSGTHFVQVDSPVTLTCEDSRGVPPPRFMWTHNGSTLTIGNHISIVDQRASVSILTINQFQASHSGEYKCSASNDAGSSYHTVTLSLPLPSRPAPPTSIHVTSLSTCSAHIEWALPQITNDDDMAPPDYVTFEVNLIGESDWTEIGTADVTQTSLMVRIPWKGANANFRFRSRCVSNSRGAGEYFTATDTFTAYSEATLSRLLSLSTQVLSSSTIQVSWTLPEQDCFNFTAFTVTCKSATRETTMDSPSIVLEGDSTMATITGLIPDTAYNCSVTSESSGSMTGELAAQVTTYATQLATTYPEFGVFQLLLTGISDCKDWIKEAAAAKRAAIAMAVAEGIEELCQCGLSTNNIQMEELWCSLFSQTTMVYQAEIHSTPQASVFPRLLSLLQEWISREPQLLIDSQLLRVDGNCSAVTLSVYNEEECGKLKSDTQQAELIISIYAIIGIAVGLALILVLSVAIVMVVITILVSRHRKTIKLNSSSGETKQDIVLRASNLAAMTIETVEYPYYEQMDLDEEPQYESLEDYDKRPSSGADKIPQPKHADCPVYEPTIIGIS